MKTVQVKVNKAEIVAMLHLLADADGGWGEPFKDLDIDEHDLEWDDVDMAVKSLLRKLKLAEKSVK